MSIPQTVSHRKPRGGSLVTIFVAPRNFPEGTRYCVARHAGADSIVYEEQDYATEFAAYVAAASTAIRLGAKLNAPDTMKARLIAYWRRRGRRMFFADQPRSLCANKYEREAYDQAERELLCYIDEKEVKPGLTDWVPMTVYAGEYDEGHTA